MDSRRYSINLDAVTSREKSSLTHGIHPYPAKFIPQIPASLIEYLGISAGSTLLDPFCGSGTTLLEANIRGIHAIGIDTNPIGCLISRVKTTPLNEAQCQAIADVIAKIKTYRAGDITADEIPSFLNRDHWFQKNVQNELAFIKKQIVCCDDPNVLDFLFLVLSSIIVKVSNQESDTRWAAKEKNIPDLFSISEFERKAIQVLEKVRELGPVQKANSTVINGDSRNLGFLADNSIAAVITSPPYMNSYDYYLYHKLRMFWLGYDHYPVQAAEIGSRNKHCDNHSGPDAYYDSIRAVAEQIYPKLVPGGYFCVVIGDSVYKGELVRMDAVYYSLFQAAGFQHMETFSFNQRKYTKAFTPNTKTMEKQSHIILFQK